MRDLGVLIACIGLVVLGYYVRILHMSIRRARIDRMKRAKGMLFTRMFNNLI